MLMASPTLQALQINPINFSQLVFEKAKTDKILHHQAVIEVANSLGMDTETTEGIQNIVKTLLTPLLVTKIQEDGIMFHMIKPNNTEKIQDEWF